MMLDTSHLLVYFLQKDGLHCIVEGLF
uniref:Uncharacterized protein n=1 Tax=Rhizophora mucronata TaxID=61149 RepID=A0A2P2QNT2_RHIMU